VGSADSRLRDAVDPVDVDNACMTFQRVLAISKWTKIGNFTVMGTAISRGEPELLYKIPNNCGGMPSLRRIRQSEWRSAYRYLGVARSIIFRGPIPGLRTLGMTSRTKPRPLDPIVALRVPLGLLTRAIRAFPSLFLLSAANSHHRFSPRPDSDPSSQFRTCPSNTSQS